MEGWRYVEYLGWLERKDVSRLLGEIRAGLVVLCPTDSYVDSLPIKLFEYMAAGIPVVASDFPVWRSIIEPHACGLLVDPTDVNAISKAMAWILSHPDEAQLMGVRGRAAVQQQYQWDHEARKLEECYVRLGV